MKNRDIVGIAALGVLVIAIIALYPSEGHITSKFAGLFKDQSAAVARTVTSPFAYNFSVDGRLSEAGTEAETTSPYWWLNSGAYMYLKGGVGTTIQGELPQKDKWRVLYNIDNPTDTDNGFHPQNIFRLITRQQWQANVREETDFNFVKYNVSASEERDVWNGALHFLRYQDQNNLYYVGIRVDGHAVFKKKIHGDYYTIVEKPVWTGTAYDRNTNPVPLIPMNTWIGMKSEIKTNTNGSVTASLYIDEGKTGTWKLVLQGTDDGRSYGGAPITTGGYGGFRTDFYDVTFDNFKLTNI